MNTDKKITVIGGPISQPVDDVLNLVPSGNGHLAESIADQFEEEFEVERLGNFFRGKPLNFYDLEHELIKLNSNVVIYLAHLPNVLLEGQQGKIRLKENEASEIKIIQAPKLINMVKTVNPECLLVAFKLAEKETTNIEIIKWALKIHAGLVVFSRLGDSKTFYILDALGNEVKVTKDELPKALVSKVKFYLQAIRRRSKFQAEQMLEVPYLNDFKQLSENMVEAFNQAQEKNVQSGRWPGNFSFRCSHGFLSARAENGQVTEGGYPYPENGFVITKRNVSKTGLTEKDFIFVSLGLENEEIVYWGDKHAKPSIDAPVHRVIYEKLPWVNFIVHGHLHAQGDVVYNQALQFWPCGAENEGLEIVSRAMNTEQKPLLVFNVEGHGFVALISDKDPKKQFEKLTELEFCTP